MKGREFLTAARSLLTTAHESTYRSAVSRAYYAVFHTAAEQFRRMGFRVPREERAHRYLSYRLQNCGEADFERAGVDLDDLRSDRNIASYDLNVSQHFATAEAAVELAERIISQLDGLSQSAVLQAVRDAIRAYERDVLGENTWRA